MKLAKREKYLVTLAACVIGAFILIEFLIAPLFEEKDRLEKGVMAKEKELREVLLLSAEFEGYKKNTQGLQDILANRRKGFTLFSFLEREAGEAQVKDHIKYMKPSTSQTLGPYKESKVEMKLEGVTLDQLARYLYRVEFQENAVTIRRMSIRENKRDTGYLDAVLQVFTLQ